MARENFKSRLGFILVSAGCAIGIGNVWKFPYVAGQNGGGVFVLFYLLFLLIMGVPVLTMELAMGRASRKGAVGSYKELEKPKSKWHLHGWAAVIGCYLLMFYYTTVAGWMFGYFIKFLTGRFDSVAIGESKAVYDTMLGNTGEMLLWMMIIVVAGFIVCSFGLQKGVEGISKFMMIGLLALIFILVVNSFTLKGAAEGLKFYLFPDFSRAAEAGFVNVISAAMNQAFFTLSLGIGSMQIFGSYMSKDNTLTSESVRICSLDTMVAIAAGLIIFPACFSFGVQPDSGPDLIFITLPNVFINMTGGRIWGTLFFLFMTFASFTTVIAVFENIISNCMENFKLSRSKTVIINGIVVLVCSLPAVFGYNLWKGANPLGKGNILFFEDYLVSTFFLPIGALIYLLFCVSKWGWGFHNYLAETNTGRGIKLPRLFKPYLQFVLPALIILLIVLQFVL